MRFIVLIMSTVILPFTTHPSKIILVLRKLRFPHWLILIITLTIRFIPMTFQNFTNTRNAQKLRRNKLRLKDITFLIGTLLITSLRTAKQMALALESRAFGASDQRTSLKIIKFKHRDLIFSIFSASILMLVFLNFGARLWML